jgi:hypothetical protein
MCIGPAAMDYTLFVYVCICVKWLSKCDLLTPGLRVEAAALAVGDKIIGKSVTKCNKVWNCVTI